MSGVPPPDWRGWLDAARHPARRDGAMLWVLLLLPWAFALILVRSHHHLDVGGITIVFAVSLGLPTLWAAWAALRVAERDGGKVSDPGLTEVAERLAARIRSQWEHEAQARGLNDPFPLPVAWTAALPPLAGDLDALKTLASSGAGWSDQARSQWAAGPEDLAGAGRELVNVLARVPTGRLVVLGEPGAGKTMLMVRLVLDLLHPDRRATDPRIPVLASLASWDPVGQDLHGWLGATLITSYPDLAGSPPPGSVGANAFEALLEAKLILPILDGLDEVSESARPTAIARINKELRPGEPVVVTCRTEQYRAAVSRQDGQGATLRAAAVRLSTLQFDEIAKYLRTDAAPGAESRWDFLDTLESGSPVRQTLAIPLFAGLARDIYNARPEEGRDSRHPPELLDFADQAAAEAYLFDAFIPTAYRHAPAGRWKAEDAERWLVFLARHLEGTVRGTDLAWWQLSRSTSRLLTGLVTGLIAGLVTALSIMMALPTVAAVSIPFDMYWYWTAVPTIGEAMLTGLKLAPVGGLAAGLLSGVAAVAVTRGSQWQRSPRVQRAAQSAVSIIAGFIVGVAAWLAFSSVGLAVGLGITASMLSAITLWRARRFGTGADLRRATSAGIVVGSMVGVASGVFWGVLYQSYSLGLTWGLPAGVIAGIGAGIGTILKGRRGDRPARGTRWSLRKAWLPASICGTASALIGQLAGGTAFGLSAGLVYGLAIAVAVAAVAGLEGVPGNLSDGASPPVSLARDRSAALSLALVTGIAAGIAAAIVANATDYAGFVAEAQADTGFSGFSPSGYVADRVLALGLGMVASAGLPVGIGFSLVIGGFGSQWPGWITTRIWLSLRGRLPWSLMSFLTDAYQRGVLRQVGAVYQFRHINLQHRLATRHTDQADDTASPAHGIRHRPDGSPNHPAG